MSHRDYYEILGVERDAQLPEIKSAYRKLAIRYHPDKNAADPVAAEKFKEASEAYSVLSDSEKRSRYDRFGRDGLRGSGAPGFGFDSSIFADFSDIFGQFFGGGFSRPQGRVGEDLVVHLEISFSEAAFGAEMPVELTRLEACEQCHGSGSAKGEPPAPCATCRGRGQVRYSQGFFSVSRTCPACRGEGVEIRHKCAACSGEGRVRQSRRLTIKIPGGVEEGSRLRLSSEGNAAPRGGTAGDLYVVLKVRDHEIFQRDGDDVLLNLELPFPVLVLGSEVDVPTLDGKEKITIHPGTAAGTEVRLRRRGMTRLSSSGRGDQVVRLSVQVPKSVGPEERELLEKYARMTNVPVSKKKTFARVKKIFEN